MWNSGVHTFVTLDASPLPPPLSAGPGVGPAERQSRRNQGRTIRKLRQSDSNTIVSFKELNSRKVDPSVVRQSVVHYLKYPERLTSMQFANLGMASSRHCDIHLAVEVCEQVGGGTTAHGQWPQKVRAGWAGRATVDHMW